MSITELIAALEKATGPDRELDERIALAIGLPATLTLGHELLGNHRRVPARVDRYTASLDAALTLVPSGNRWVIEAFEGTPVRAFCSKGFAGNRAQAVAATPAIALCIAALKARVTA